VAQNAPKGNKKALIKVYNLYMFLINCQVCKKEVSRKTASAKFCLPCAKERNKQATSRINKESKSNRAIARLTKVRDMELLADKLANKSSEARSYLNECLVVNLPVLIEMDFETIEIYLKEEVDNFFTFIDENGPMVGLCRICKFQNNQRICDDNHPERVHKKLTMTQKEKKGRNEYTRRYAAAKRSGTGIKDWKPSEIRKRDKNICQICYLPIPYNVKGLHELAFTVDHIIPISSGGENEEPNLQSAHRRCNNWKSASIEYKHTKTRQNYMEKLIKLHNF
jgi:5-methylcytosine-specific restriction endonuclease McrA